MSTAPKSFKHIKVGDTITRNLCGAPMKLVVTQVDETYIIAGAWTFERDTGFEYDPDLGWGSQYGATGSFLV